MVDYSPKFKRELPRLQNVKHFEGILIHRGNTAEDSAGCILVGENKVKGGGRQLHALREGTGTGFLKRLRTGRNPSPLKSYSHVHANHFNDLAVAARDHRGALVPPVYEPPRDPSTERSCVLRIAQKSKGAFTMGSFVFLSPKYHQRAYLRPRVPAMCCNLGRGAGYGCSYSPFQAGYTACSIIMGPTTTFLYRTRRKSPRRGPLTILAAADMTSRA